MSLPIWFHVPSKGCLLRGVSATGGVCSGVSATGGVCSGGCLLRGGAVCSWGGLLPEGVGGTDI